MKIRQIIPLLIILLIFAISGCNKENDKNNCALEPDPGNCKASFPRYYYDRVDKMCKEFIWGGCYGVVPFVTLEKCQESCE